MYNCVHVQLIISVTDLRYSAQILLENAFLCRQNARVKNHLFYSKFCRQNLFKPIHLKTRKKAGKHWRPHWFGERQQSHSVCFTAEFMGNIHMQWTTFFVFLRELAMESRWTDFYVRDRQLKKIRHWHKSLSSSRSSTVAFLYPPLTRFSKGHNIF